MPAALPPAGVVAYPAVMQRVQRLCLRRVPFRDCSKRLSELRSVNAELDCKLIQHVCSETRQQGVYAYDALISVTRTSFFSFGVHGQRKLDSLAYGIMLSISA